MAMKIFARVSIIISLIFSMIACSVSSSQTNKPSEITLTDEKPIVVLDTGNSDYPRIALYKGGEVIVPDLDVNQNGEIIGVRGTTFIAPDGNSIYLYFENGKPVRAIVDEHLIQFENFSGDTVDITFVSPDGTVTQKEKVPFDSNQLPSIGSQSSAHLASMVRLPNNEDIDWFPFIQNATTAFLCAAAVVATIVPSGGTSAVILGAGCAVLAYNTYLAIANKEPPVSVEKADIVISGAGCALGIAQKEPIAVKDCADTVIDTVQIAKKKSQETEQKLVTMVGANPNTRSELAIEAIAEPVLTSPVETITEEEVIEEGGSTKTVGENEMLGLWKIDFYLDETKVYLNGEFVYTETNTNLLPWHLTLEENGVVIDHQCSTSCDYSWSYTNGEFHLAGGDSSFVTYDGGATRARSTLIGRFVDGKLEGSFERIVEWNVTTGNTGEDISTGTWSGEIK